LGNKGTQENIAQTDETKKKRGNNRVNTGLTEGIKREEWKRREQALSKENYQ
jgi:hypothetical protein